MDSPTKVALLGVGKWGKNLLKELVIQTEVVYILHQGKTETKNWIKENYPNIKIANSYEEILNDKGVQAICIATPTETHYNLVLKALSAGKHVFVEKPGTKTSAEMQDLCIEASKRNLILSVGYVFLHHPVFSKIKELVENQKIESIHFEWLKWGTFTEPPALNLLSHEISIMIALGLTPEKKETYSQNSIVSEADILEIELKSNQTKITSYINRLSSDKRKSVVIKTDKNIYIWENNNLFVLDKNNLEKQEIKIEETKTPLNLEIYEFIKNIKEENVLKMNGDLAVQVLKIIEIL